MIHTQKINGKRKAQIETMGLLVIVILVSIILFFVLVYNSNRIKNVEPDKQEFKDSQAIGNFGTTMLETTDDCGRTIRELLTDCAFKNQITCNDIDSCTSAQNTMEKILDLTLNEWGYEYTLSVNKEQGGVVFQTEDACDSPNFQRERTPFGTTYGNMYVEIKVCK